MRTNISLNLSPQLDGLDEQDHFSYFGVYDPEAENGESERQRILKAAFQFYDEFLTENLDQLKAKSAKHHADQEALNASKVVIRDILITCPWYRTIDPRKVTDESYLLGKMAEYARRRLADLGQFVITITDAHGKTVADTTANFELVDGCWESTLPISMTVPADAQAPLPMHLTFGTGKRWTFHQDVSDQIVDGQLHLAQVRLGAEVQA